MGLSKSQRIMVLLAIDTAFFLLEIIIGYSVHSLALVADSFHMLNDVISLCVGLWAVKVANQTTNSKMYTYGWQRAETLGALVNGVFLVALCLSIFLEAIQRFVEPQVVSSPRLVFIVGCMGLVSNVLGLLLFHEHGHSHGDVENLKEQVGDTYTAQQHRQYTATVEHDDRGNKVADERGNVEDVLPQNAVAALPSQQAIAKQALSITQRHGSSSDDLLQGELNRPTTFETNASGPKAKIGSPNNSQRRHRRHTSGSRPRYASVDGIYVHPANFRHEIIAASRLENIESDPATESDENASINCEHEVSSEVSPLLGQKRRSSLGKASNGGTTQAVSELLHSGHNHRQPKKEVTAQSGHSHGDLNMRGVFLHVMGDALGNIGVIASALIIWLTDFWWRFYTDPLISLIITVIILFSAIPLCRAASRILLQAVPAGISIDDIKEDIEDLEGVVSCHHLHVWQLSDTKLVASLHIQVAFGYKGADSEQYMKLAKAVRTCLHEYGIHSSTIQPEFCLDESHKHITTSQDSAKTRMGSTESIGDPVDNEHAALKGSRNASIQSLHDACLLDCDDKCDSSKGCCAPASAQNIEGNSSH